MITQLKVNLDTDTTTIDDLLIQMKKFKELEKIKVPIWYKNGPDVYSTVMQHFNASTIYSDHRMIPRDKDPEPLKHRYMNQRKKVAMLTIMDQFGENIDQFWKKIIIEEKDIEERYLLLKNCVKYPFPYFNSEREKEKYIENIAINNMNNKIKKKELMPGNNELLKRLYIREKRELRLLEFKDDYIKALKE